MGPNFVLDKGYQIAGTVYPAIFTLVKLGTAPNEVESSNVAGEEVLGVLQEDVPSPTNANSGGLDYIALGRVVNVRLMGISRCVAAGAIALGARVVSNGDGTAKTIVAATTNQNVVGIALSAATTAGDQFDLLLTPGATADA